MGSTIVPELKGGVARPSALASITKLASRIAVPGVLAITVAASPARGVPDDAPTTRATTTAADAPATNPATAPAKTFTIANIAFAYSPGSANPVPEADVRREAIVRLTPLPGGGFDAGDGIDSSAISLEQLSGAPRPFTAAAVDRIKDAVRQYFNDRGIFAVIVETDVESESRKNDLTVTATVGIIKEIRTVAAGDRIKRGPRENNPAHAFILRNSPVTTEAENNAVRKDELDEYVLWLNRHPGRRVDLALSPAAADPANPDAPGVALDYIVTEAKPWTVLAELSNTGTKDTNEWRERFAFTNNQLRGKDDIFYIEYSTAGFSDSHVFNISYDFPISPDRKFRLKPYGLYSEFVASDVGFAGQDFLGNEAAGGLEMTYTAAQWRETFLDVFGGAKVQWAKVRNRIGEGNEPVAGEATFFEPYGGVRLTRVTDTNAIQLSTGLLFGDTDAGQEQLDRLRVNADRKFGLLQFSANLSTFLEPIFQREEFELGRSTLAHQVAFSFRGQTSFGDRLIPQNEETAGGLYTVRGYEESVAAGDTVFLGTLEYRIHVPRTFQVQPEPMQVFGRPFRYAPQTPFGATDWDIVGKVFIDGGQTINHQRLPFEHDNTLLSVGLGVEFLYRDNFGIRIDWGVALTEARSSGSSGNATEPGDNRFHFVFTAQY